MDYGVQDSVVDEMRNDVNNSILCLIGWRFGGNVICDEDREVLTFHGRTTIRQLAVLAWALIDFIHCWWKWLCLESFVSSRFHVSKGGMHGII